MDFWNLLGLETHSPEFLHFVKTQGPPTSFDEFMGERHWTWRWGEVLEQEDKVCSIVLTREAYREQLGVLPTTLSDLRGSSTFHSEGDWNGNVWVRVKLDHGLLRAEGTSWGASFEKVTLLPLPQPTTVLPESYVWGPIPNEWQVEFLYGDHEACVGLCTDKQFQNGVRYCSYGLPEATGGRFELSLAAAEPDPDLEGALRLCIISCLQDGLVPRSGRVLHEACEVKAHPDLLFLKGKEDGLLHVIPTSEAKIDMDRQRRTSQDFSFSNSERGA